MSRSRKTATRRFEDRTHQKDAGRFTVGVVGLGLMGTSIATCLLAAGHPVVGVERDPSKRSRALRRVLGFLREMKAEKLARRPLARRRSLQHLGGFYRSRWMRSRDRIHL
jgi:lactate dehydrogenase-like 2-hydroxyacid dehydrogenase